MSDQIVSSAWVLNALAGKSFPNQGQAYDYMKRCLDSSMRAQRLNEANKRYSDAQTEFITAKDALFKEICPKNVKLVQDVAQALQDSFTRYKALFDAMYPARTWP